jgi:hypothetical protein
MQRLSILTIITILSAAIILSGCEEPKQLGPSQKPIGGDKDAHGCLPAAGYQWCPSTQKCQRMWEDYCEEYKDQFRGTKISSFDECAAAGNPVMESYPRQCRAQGRTFVEEI